ncbi:hypothetical protein HN51_024682 [Arachis hypogaea]|uniref:OVATE domain-containing protein n=1 Tax=Arachis hypogaea TaxID=3818 RepID=A0A445C7F3_ARAHY|nr:transcription repressor OFP17 [Arachis hypogaea]RYR46875.1 hypothetical protein Ahy_A07g032731 [Arachis hypogaea]
MKVKAWCAFKSKLLNLKPCRKLILFFKVKRSKKKSFSIRACTRSNAHKIKYSEFQNPSNPRKPIMSSLLSVFRSSPKKSKDMGFSQEGPRSPALNILETPVIPSPLSPGFVSVPPKVDRKEGASQDVKDACRSFENYLVEMIVEEGKTKDLMDVEELLYCWKNLKSPVFIDLVCRFYGELCKDLFSSDSEDLMA